MNVEKIIDFLKQDISAANLVKKHLFSKNEKVSMILEHFFLKLNNEFEFNYDIDTINEHFYISVWNGIEYGNIGFNIDYGIFKDDYDIIYELIFELFRKIMEFSDRTDYRHILIKNGLWKLK